MDLRTKLVFVLVAVSLGSMAVLGGFAYGATRDLLRQSALRQLEAVAETKRQDLSNALAAWGDRVDLIASRTQLRLSLRELLRGGGVEERARIARILRDAQESVLAVRRIAVFAPDGSLVAETQARTGGSLVRPAGLPADDPGTTLEGLSLGPDGDLEVTYAAPMELEGQSIGSIEVVLRATELLDVTRDYTGLGETGETLVAMRVGSGDALVVNPLRHRPDASLRLQIAAARDEVPAVRAVRGEQAAYREGVVDYRGERVWAATRFLPDVGVGVVVKVDAKEELRSVTELRDTMLRLGVSLSAFAVVIGTGLGLYFARPIRELAQVAQRVRRGEHDLRARVSSEDEIALLAAAFNEMTEELVEANRALEVRVSEQEPPSH